MFVLIYFVSLFLFYFYFKGLKVQALFCLFFIFTDGYGFIDDGGPVKTNDIILFFTFCVLVNETIKNPQFISLKNDDLGIVLMVFVCVTVLIMLGTIILGIETPLFALKCGRWSLNYLIYFYIRTLSFGEIKSLVKVLFVCTLITGIAYYLQFFGVNLLTGRIDEARSMFEKTRYLNIPDLLSFFFVYFYLRKDIGEFKKILFLSFWGGMFVFAMWRGGILKVAIMIGIYIFLRGKRNQLYYIFLGYFAYIFVINPMFQYRDRNKSQENGAFQEIKNIIVNPEKAYKDYLDAESEGGNYAFRFAMVYERVLYLIDNPQYFPFGMGTIHEESPNQTFYFNLGTVNEKYKYGKGILHSTDVELVTIICLYGFVGLFFYLLIYYVWIKKSISLLLKTNEPLIMLSALTSFGYLVSLFNGNYIVGSYLENCIYFSIVSVICQKSYNEN